MFYDARQKNHGLTYDPFKAIVSQRPIGWISTLSADGIFNLAPYSFFNAVSDNPHIVMFSSVGWKDSARNARDSGEFVCNHVGELHEAAMNATSVAAPSNVSEAEYAGIELAPSTLVKPSRVKGVWAALECKTTQILEPHDSEGNKCGNLVVFGEVVGVYIHEEAIVEGRFDVEVTRPVSRGGYLDFGRTGERFQMKRPAWED